LVAEIPTRALLRGARLAPLSIAAAGCAADRGDEHQQREGRERAAAVLLGRRLTGEPGELVAAELQARAAERLFTVLGELKGGARSC
jgi:hypothetical protein